MIMIDSMIWIILMVEIGHMTETGHIIETGTAPENTKETGHMIEIDYMAEMIHIVETGHIVQIDHETTVEMSIRRKVINIRGRSRDYYEDIYENRHGMDKYECQFRNDRYEIIRGRPKEIPCSHSDQKL